MLAPVVCSLCGRRGCKPADGAAINSLGCTGACLRWAVRVIKNRPLFDDEFDWGAWNGVRPADVASFRAICSDVNELGYGYLHWDFVNSHQGPGDLLAAHWIALAHERYAYFLNSADEDMVATLCPDVLALFQSLDIVHQSCLQVPTVLYTLHCEVTEADFCRVQSTTMSGQLVNDVVMRRGVPLNAWQHVPEPPYRIADDGNLYTRQEFEH